VRLCSSLPSLIHSLGCEGSTEALRCSALKPRNIIGSQGISFLVNLWYYIYGGPGVPVLAFPISPHAVEVLMRRLLTVSHLPTTGHSPPEDLDDEWRRLARSCEGAELNRGSRRGGVL